MITTKELTLKQPNFGIILFLLGQVRIMFLQMFASRVPRQRHYPLCCHFLLRMLSFTFSSYLQLPSIKTITQYLPSNHLAFLLSFPIFLLFQYFQRIANQLTLPYTPLPLSSCFPVSYVARCCFHMSLCTHDIHFS